MATALNLASAAIDPVLTKIAIQSTTGGPFIADQLLPVRNVVKDFARYTVIGRENITADVNVKRAFGAPANRRSISRTYKTVSITAERALAIPLADELVQNAPDPSSVQAQRTDTVMTNIRLDIERDVKTLVDSITHTASPAYLWSGSTATIEADIDAAKELFVLQFGIEANSILIPIPVARIAKRDSKIRDLIRYTHQDLLINGDLPPVFFNLNTITPRAITKDSAATALRRIWNSKDVTLFYIDPNKPDEDTVTWGLQVRAPTGSGLQATAYSWRDPDPTAGTSYVAAAIKQTEIIANDGLALTIKNVIS